MLYPSYLDERWPSQSDNHHLDRGFLMHRSHHTPNTDDGVSPGTNWQELTVATEDKLEFLPGLLLNETPPHLPHTTSK